MKIARVLYHLALADCRERVRRYSFLLTLVGALYLAYAVIVGDFTLSFGGYRGAYNSAYVGLQMAMVALSILSLAGFYVVKNTVDRDRQTHVGEVLATTPISKLHYMLGKWLSNLTVLCLILAALMVAALLGQLWAGEDRHIDLWNLCAPFLFLTFPGLCFVAGAALFFEVIPWLRHGLGNILYFLLVMFGMVAGIEAQWAATDLVGILWLGPHFEMFLYSHVPGYQGGMSIGDTGVREFRVFVWKGFDWNLEMISARLYWIGVGLVLLLISAWLFDRFDPVGGKPIGAVRAGPEMRPNALARWWARVRASQHPAESPAARAPLISPAQMTDVPVALSAVGWKPILKAELLLLLKRQRWWWYAVAAAICVVSLSVEASSVRQTLVFAWVWPVLVWSAMGTQEARYRTHELIFSSRNSLVSQFPAAWLAGVLVACLAGSGAVLRLAVGHDWEGLLGFVAGAVFIPSLALAMGVWSGSRKLFEAVYFFWWYIGPAHHMPSWDFTLSWGGSCQSRALWCYLLGAMALFAIALWGRRRQFQAR
jgi:hypothetical protein